MAKVSARTDPELAKKFGAELRAARLRVGLTQEEAARRLGTAPMVLGRLEKGRAHPSLPMLRRLCVELNVGADRLLGLTEEPPLRRTESPALLGLLNAARSLPAVYLRLLRRLAQALQSALLGAVPPQAVGAEEPPEQEEPPEPGEDAELAEDSEPLEPAERPSRKRPPTR